MTSSPRLRVISRGEFIAPAIRARLQRDLGFEISFTVFDNTASLRQVVTEPESFDVYHQWHTSDLIWTARCIQGIDLRRIGTGAQIKAAARVRSGVTHAIFDRLFVQDDGRLGHTPTDTVAVLPTLHGVDGFVWRPSQATPLRPGERESWGWMLDPRWAGHVGIIADPALGMIEAALATEAQLGTPFRNIGNLTIDEIDTIADYMIHKKKIGHFRGTWTSQAEAVRLMRRGAVTLQSLFSPAVAELRAMGMQIAVADPVEGSRGWHSDLSISAVVEGDTLEAAYAYLNWWHNGWAGACLSRQGYYFILPELARPHLRPAEWDYWYDGQPAAEPLRDASGAITIPEGHRREGGSYRARMASARVWNTFMDEHTHITRRWQEFLSA